MTYPQQTIPTEPDSGSTFIHSNSTVAASGSIVMTGVGSKEVTLVVNVTAAPTGTLPTLTYTLQEVDPGDQLAVFGPTSSTPTINAIGVYTATLGATIGGAVKVSWVVAGTGASFTGVYATASSKIGTASNTSGAVVVSDASIGANNAAAPGSSSQIGGSDGANLQSVRVFDADSGAGSQYVLGAVLRKSATGGSVEAGTSSDPLRVDPTGTTTQPISAASLPLPAGAATEATLATRLAEATFTGRINTLGQKPAAASTPVILASDQTSIPITDGGGSLTVDGSVAVTSVVPGVGATSLGKAEDAAAVSGDTGVAMLGVYQPDTVLVSAGTPGDYATLNIDDKGRLRVSPGAVVSIDDFDSIAGFTPFNTDTANIALTTNHVRGVNAITFDIVNSAANSPFALIQKTIPPLDLTGLATGATFIQVLIFLPSLLNVRHVIVRLGTDAANYNSWSASIADSSAVAGVWQTFRSPIGNSDASVGNGWNLSAITYFAVGLELDNVNSVIAGVVIDSLHVIGGQIHASDVHSEISTVVSTNKVDLTKIGGRNVETDRGVSTPATLRVAIASDDSNLSVINTNQTSGLQQTRISDGSTVAAVKGPSTAAAAADPALVVAVSPNSTVPISAASLPLPLGAATEATLATRLAEATFTGRINTFGQKASAASTPVVLASDQTAIPISDNSGSLTVDGAVTANIGTTNGLALDATLTGGTQTTRITSGANTAAVKAASAAAVAADPALVVAISPNNTLPISAASLPLPTGAATEATLATRLTDVTFTTRINTLGQKTAAASTPVVLASDQSPISVTDNGGSLTVDGSVAITSVIPGVGATNLGKAEDSASASGDTGVAILGVYQPDTVGVSAGTPGDYATLNVDEKGRLRVAPGGIVRIDSFDTVDGFSPFNDNAANIATTTNHVRGVNAVSFDRVVGSANTPFGLIQKTIPPIDLSGIATGSLFIQLLVFFPSLSNVRNVVIRLGTDAANYNSWAVSVKDAEVEEGVWQTFRAIVGHSNPSVGSGWNTAAVTYFAVGVEMDNFTNTSAGIVVDSFYVIGGGINASDDSSEITSVVSTPKIDLVKVGGNNTSTNRGNASDGSLRVAIATDDYNLMQIRASQTDGSQQTQITDGFRAAAVTAASTAPVAADQALVVAISPNSTLPISAASLPLPAGAATEATLATRLAEATFTARVNTLGQKTAATSTPVVLASDQTAVPVSGTVTANIGTSGSLALNATLTGGTAKAVVRGGAKGTTTAADVTSSASGANRQLLDVAMYDAAGNQITTFGGGQQYADGAARGTATGTLLMLDDGTNIQSASADTAGRLNVLSRVTDGTNTATVKAASTAAVASDTALVVAVSPNSTTSTLTPDVTATGALGALNATVQLATTGIGSVGFQLAAGTLIGTILPEVSFDGGTTWVITHLDDPSTGLKAPSVVFAAANTAIARVVVGVGGAGHTRIRVSAYTSGTANITLRGSARPGAVLARFTTAGAGYSVLTSPNALPLGITGQVTAYGTLKVTTEGSELFSEPFDGPVIDTANRWTQTLVGGATMTQGSGSVTMATGVVASTAAGLSSQNNFRPVGLSYQIFGASVQLEAAALTNVHRFWGMATVPGSWTAATPILDGVGFEQDINGGLFAVVYSGGVKVTSLSLVRPVDGQQHRYAIYMRTDLIYWYLDTLEVPVSGANFPSMGQQALPIRLHCINHTTPPASAPTFNLIGVAVSETSHSGVQLSDGTFPWRKATVDTAGRLQAGVSSAVSGQTSVAASASSVQLLAANLLRRGATVFNDSSSVMYLKLGVTASTTSFTVRMVSFAYYEVPFGYVGRIDAIWSAAIGNARITELS